MTPKDYAARSCSKCGYKGNARPCPDPDCPSSSSVATPSGLAVFPSALDLVRERRDALEAAGASQTQAYVIALEERLMDEHDENQRLWDQQPQATIGKDAVRGGIPRPQRNLGMGVGEMAALLSLGGDQRPAGGGRDGSAAPTGERPAQTVYSSVVSYLRANGWQREEVGSGWWWKADHSMDENLGGALLEQLRRDGVDTRAEKEPS